MSINDYLLLHVYTNIDNSFGIRRIVRVACLRDRPISDKVAQARPIRGIVCRELARFIVIDIPMSMFIVNHVTYVILVRAF